MNTLLRYALLLSLLLAPCTTLLAQIGINSPTGVKPTNDFEVYTRGNFFVQQKYRYVTTDPNASINNLSCVSPSANLTALAGILKDPNGDANYTPGLSYSCIQTVYLGSIDSQTLAGGVIIGIELTVEEFGTDSDDRLLIHNSDNKSVIYPLSGSDWAGLKLIVTGTTARFSFITDNDANAGSGFRIKWRALIQENSDPNAFIVNAFGSGFSFDTYRSSFRAGMLNQSQTGEGFFTFAAGYQNEVSGASSAALGHQNDVDGTSSVALGRDNFVNNSAFAAITAGRSNTAIDDYSLSMGDNNRAAGDASLALGRQNSTSAVGASSIGLQNRALGEAALALGESNTAISANGVAIGLSNISQGISAVTIGESSSALGQRSVAMGYKASTNNFAGAFILGDNSTTTITSTTANQYTARFTGGFRMVTAVNGSGVPTAGVSLTAGGTSWATLSDSTRKELFLPIDGPDLLRKISGMKLTMWNYKGQRGIRHYGPMAQEFFSLFGRDTYGTVGSDKLITTQDIEGLTLTAVQALARENEQLKAEIKALKTERSTQANRIAQSEKRLDALESILLAKRQRSAYRVAR
ncbi:hypothetical protein IC229_14940 [Spirosoma sp. BT702]|uniref:Peptidase S74 domain-containing protein n=1 Tax=Spirosoma profusum TaxID=2771354 RepID=A0A926Y1M9_9BACT|nr:tail fiber domain-containing protein [Spirosoma profusum]MBD2701943.1 hypothetical protein [Spirosoma profusum]